MTTEELKNALHDSVKLDIPELGVDSLYKYQLGRCHHPITLKRLDPVTNEIREFQVPCGRCLHCRQTKRTEWVIRLYAHAEMYSYIYFTTLTYAPISGNSILFPESDFMLRYLSEAIWHYDSDNSNGTLAYSPCVIVKSHYQKFIKRLRSQLPSTADLSYFICGEYGSKFGRPHFHLIIFSQSPISAELVQNCWSVHYHICPDNTIVKRTNQKTDNYSIPIGKIDHQDLKMLGDFDTLKDSNNKNSARHCFRYVCKYIFKKTFPTIRLDLGYESLFPCSDKTELGSLINRCSPNFHGNLYAYFPDIIDLSKYPYDYVEFKKAFRPFTECSRSRAIGKNFLLSHIKEYQEGNYVKPSFYKQGHNVTPQYFMRKVRQSLFALQKFEKQSGQKPSFVTGNLFALREDLLLQRFDRVFGQLYYTSFPSATDIKKALSLPDNTIKDAFDNTRYIACCEDNQHFVCSFVYNRHFKDYDFVNKIPVETFVESQLQKLNTLFRYHIKNLQLQDYEKELQNQVTHLLDNLDICQMFNLQDKNADLPHWRYDFSLKHYICEKIKRDYYSYTSNHYVEKNLF